jgi:hypothetical protein
MVLDSVDLAHIQPNNNNEANLNIQINQALDDTWWASNAPQDESIRQTSDDNI